MCMREVTLILTSKKTGEKKSGKIDQMGVDCESLRFLLGNWLIVTVTGH